MRCIPDIKPRQPEQEVIMECVKDKTQAKWPAAQLRCTLCLPNRAEACAGYGSFLKVLAQMLMTNDCSGPLPVSRYTGEKSAGDQTQGLAHAGQPVSPELHL